jgi:hypothetical protein
MSPRARSYRATSKTVVARARRALGSPGISPETSPRLCAPCSRAAELALDAVVAAEELVEAVAEVVRGWQVVSVGSGTARRYGLKKAASTGRAHVGGRFGRMAALCNTVLSKRRILTK